MITINTRVRPAALGDALQMTKLLNAVIAAGGTTAHQTPLVVDEMFSRYIRPENNISCHVAISNGRLSGFQSLVWADDAMPEGWAIIATFVAFDRAKMGIGQKLFSATRFAAKAAEVKTIDTRYGHLDEITFDGEYARYSIARIPPRARIDADADLYRGNPVEHADFEALLRRMPRFGSR